MKFVLNRHQSITVFIVHMRKAVGSIFELFCRRQLLEFPMILNTNPKHIIFKNKDGLLRTHLT